MRLLRRYQCPFCDRHTITAWGIKRHVAQQTRLTLFVRHYRYNTDLHEREMADLPHDEVWGTNG